MAAFIAVYLREMRILRRRLKKHLAAQVVSPLLYLVTFGYALGSDLSTGDHSYLEFLLPGLVGMNSMTQAFGIASEINIARFHTCVFEEIQASPASRLSYVLGEICAALTRVAIGCAVILLLGLAFGVRLHCGVYFWLATLMNGFAFAALAVALAMLVKSHADQSLLGNFVITPMAFLGGSFFPLDKLPAWAQNALSVLPLTHATKIIRADALEDIKNISPTPFLILAAFGAASLLLALHAVAKAKD